MEEAMGGGHCRPVRVQPQQRECSESDSERGEKMERAARCVVKIGFSVLGWVGVSCYQSTTQHHSSSQAP